MRIRTRTAVLVLLVASVAACDGPSPRSPQRSASAPVVAAVAARPLRLPTVAAGAPLPGHQSTSLVGTRRGTDGAR